MKIIILDFSTAEVFVFPFDENMYDDSGDFFDSEYCVEKGIRKTNCEYMVLDDLKIQIL